jgi:hypothetical protein
MLDQNKPQNVEYFKCLGSVVYDARCTREFKSKFAIAKAAFRKSRILFSIKLKQIEGKN